MVIYTVDRVNYSKRDAKPVRGLIFKFVSVRIAGMSDWYGQRRNVQGDLCSVLSARR